MLPALDLPPKMTRPATGTPRVLIVEDSPFDADLMVRELRRGGYVETRVVQDEPSFMAALSDFQPDVVLSDNRLPRFSGERAFAITRGLAPHVPVILVTGTLEEERLVDMMNHGLADYVLKDRMLRLLPSVRAALARARAQRQVDQTLRELEASEGRFRAVAEASGDALFLADAEGGIVFWNPAARKMFSFEDDEILGTELQSLIPEVVLKAGPGTVEVTARRVDGSEFPVEVTVSTWMEHGAAFFSAQVRDITDRVEQARLREILGQAVEQTESTVVIFDLQGTIQYANPAVCALTRYSAEELDGRNALHFAPTKESRGEYARLWRQLVSGERVRTEIAVGTKDGGEYTQRTVLFPLLEEDGGLLGYAMVGQDVTEANQVALQLRQAQKMEAMGVMAGGIAHDFNNILTGVLTNAQLLEMMLPEGDEEPREYARDVITSARRGSDLVRRLMSMSRPDGGLRRCVNLREVVDEAVHTVRRVLPESIEIDVQHDDPELPATLDDGGLHQALLNLSTNARDAMPNGGKLTIRTRSTVDGDAQAVAVIEVRDTGCGMDQATVERVFEPFFTTKEIGRGTGLGLPMVYGFVIRERGNIDVHSEPGRGTRFTLRLPLDGASNVSPGTVIDEPVVQAAPVRYSGTVLLAEDQEELAQVAARILGRMGFTVQVASDGDAAVAILERDRGKIDLVVADIVMPHGGGCMLYRHAERWDDRPRFLLTSGYTQRELNGDQALARKLPFLPKPWSLAEFENAIHDVLRS